MRAAFLVLLTGCSSILGIGDVTLVDGGSDGPPPNTVIGTSFERCLTATGNMEVPLDQSAVVIEALLPSTTDPTGYTKVTGTGKADGSFVIENVPDGMEYILKVGKVYYVTTSHAVDVHFEEPIRCEPKPVALTQTTKINFNVTNMQKFAQTDDFSTFDGIEVDAFNSLYQGSSAAPFNATAFTASYDWGVDGVTIDGTPVTLLDASAHDDLNVFHNRTEPLTGQTLRHHPFLHLIDVFQPTGVSLQDGVTASVTGAFMPAANNKSMTLSITRGQFDSLYDDFSQFASMSVTLFAHPVVNDFPTGATVMSVDFTDWSRNASLNEVLNVSYADPLPASWARLLELQYLRPRFILFPGTTTPRAVFGFAQREIIYTGGNPNLASTLGAPKATIADQPAAAGGAIRLVGVKPITIKWPAVTNAKQYEIVIRKVFANGAQTRDQTVAVVNTTNTSVDVPAEAFSDGEFFDFLIEAIVAPNDFGSGVLTPNGAPSQFAVYPSGMFRINTTCGNGIKDTGEDCDTSGMSAMCDVDCTLPKCGDGLLNTLAGEECDTIRDTAGCNGGTCKMSKCGDGYINTVSEDCDDGNAIDDGNGCSTLCKFNNVCGNSHVENLVEQCDTGGVDTATCDSDCTLPVCGDGHLNLVAGEKCDDGNTISGDGCSSTCQIE